MADWAAFAGVTAVVCSLLLVLAHATATAVGPESDAAGPEGSPAADGSRPPESSDSDADAGPERTPTGPDDQTPIATDASGERTRYVPSGTRADRDGIDGGDRRNDPSAGGDGAADADGPAGPTGGGPPDLASLSTGVLFANVLLTQGALAGLLLAGAWLSEIPPGALGVAPGTKSTGLPAVAAGAVLGTVLYVFNATGAVAVRRLGVDASEDLRAALAPDTVAGWVVLLGGVLPLVAGFEELLFRAALIGAMHAGFGVAQWLLVAGSAAVFGLGHGMQGPGGVVVTAVLGVALGAAFVTTGSLLVVVVAHYLVNALEFLVHEWLALDPSSLAPASVVLEDGQRGR